MFAFDYLYLSNLGSVIPRAELGDREDIDLVILVAEDLLGNRGIVRTEIQRTNPPVGRVRS